MQWYRVEPLNGLERVKEIAHKLALTVLRSASGKVLRYCTLLYAVFILYTNLYTNSDLTRTLTRTRTRNLTWNLTRTLTRSPEFPGVLDDNWFVAVQTTPWFDVTPGYSDTCFSTSPLCNDTLGCPDYVCHTIETAR